MYTEKYTLAINELKQLNLSLTEYVNEISKYSSIYQQNQGNINSVINTAWGQLRFLKNEFEEIYEKGELSIEKRKSVYLNMKGAEVIFLFLFYMVEWEDTATENLKNQIDLTRTVVIDFLGKEEYDISYLKERYSYKPSVYSFKFKQQIL